MYLLNMSGHRLAGAFLRVGVNSDIFQNKPCGLPITELQASALGGWVVVECNPPVPGRFVSVNMQSAWTTILTLCEVIVQEYKAGPSVHGLSQQSTVSGIKSGFLAPPPWYLLALYTLCFPRPYQKLHRRSRVGNSNP